MTHDRRLAIDAYENFVTRLDDYIREENLDLALDRIHPEDLLDAAYLALSHEAIVNLRDKQMPEAPTAGAPMILRLIPTTYRDSQWRWDKHVKVEPADVPYANAVEYHKLPTSAADAQALIAHLTEKFTLITEA